MLNLQKIIHKDDMILIEDYCKFTYIGSCRSGKTYRMLQALKIELEKNNNFVYFLTKWHYNNLIDEFKSIKPDIVVSDIDTILKHPIKENKSYLIIIDSFVDTFNQLTQCLKFFFKENFSIFIDETGFEDFLIFEYLYKYKEITNPLYVSSQEIIEEKYLKYFDKIFITNSYLKKYSSNIRSEDNIPYEFYEVH